MMKQLASADGTNNVMEDADNFASAAVFRMMNREKKCLQGYGVPMLRFS
jgi:hypothetical protein